MIVVRSAWVVPVETPPIENGAVALQDGAIVAVGTATDVLAAWGERARRERGPQGVIDLGAAVVLPALVNAHTHLELSWMKNEALPRGDHVAWVRAMIRRRAPDAKAIRQPVAESIAALLRGGIAAVGDVGNSAAALEILRASPLEGRFFLEVLGWGARGDARCDDAAAELESAPEAPAVLAPWPASLVPHGPHSVSPELLARLAARARLRGDVVSIHLAESAAEDALLRRGEGPLRALMDEIGALPAGWTPPGLSPAQVLDKAGLLGPRTLAVHGVHLTREDARLIAARGATLALCPRSNAWLGVGAAPVAMLLEEGVRLALGTDSLASNLDLDLFAELGALRELAPAAPPSALLRAATLGGAEALELPSFGSLASGRRGPLVALPLVSSRSPGPDAGTGSSVRANRDDRDDDRTDRDDEPYRTIFAGPHPPGLRVIHG